MDASHNIGGNSIAGCRLGNAEIRYLYLAILGNNNILRLNISVYNMVVVGGFNPHGNLNGDTDCLFNGETGFFLNIVFQGNSLY